MDHEVRFLHGETSTWGQLYCVFQAELVDLKEWLEENMFRRIHLAIFVTFHHTSTFWDNVGWIIKFLYWFSGYELYNGEESVTHTIDDGDIEPPEGSRGTYKAEFWGGI